MAPNPSNHWKQKYSFEHSSRYSDRPLYRQWVARINSLKRKAVLPNLSKRIKHFVDCDPLVFCSPKVRRFFLLLPAAVRFLWKLVFQDFKLHPKAKEKPNALDSVFNLPNRESRDKIRRTLVYPLATFFLVSAIIPMVNLNFYFTPWSPESKERTKYDKLYEEYKRQSRRGVNTSSSFDTYSTS